MSKAELIKKIIDQLAIERYDSQIKGDIMAGLHRLSYRDLGWLENRIEIAVMRNPGKS